MKSNLSLMYQLPFLMRTFFISSMIMTLLFSCKKEEISPNSPQNPTTTASNALYSGITISTSIGGEVSDEFGAPVPNALVTVGSEQVYTNDLGFFLFDNITVDQNRAFVKVEKNGYFLGAKSIKPSSSAVSYVNMQLISQVLSGVVDNSQGGVISVSGGPSLSFEAGDISKENGDPYNGSVSVYAKYLDPTAPNIGEIMPGDLDAIDANGDAVALVTYGMIVVELVGSSGEQLNVANGEQVELTMPVQAVQSSSAPASIPLWHFDETLGNWVEEGTATLQGNSYVGQVSHFSFWNCDVPFPIVNLELRVHCNNVPIANVEARLESPTGFYYGTSYTNGDGIIDEAIPAGLPLVLKIFDGCGNLVHQENLGTPTADVDLGDIELCSSASAVTAVLKDCNDTPISNGLLSIQIGSNSIPFFTDANGSVNSLVFTCLSDSVLVSGFDLTQGLQSTPQWVQVSPTMNLGNIIVCDQVQEYIEYTLDGTTFLINDLGLNEVWAQTDFLAPPGSTGGHIGIRSGINNTGPLTFSIWTEHLGIGTYLNSLVPGVTNGVGFNINGILGPPDVLTVVYTEYGAVAGDYYAATFQGNFTDTNGTSHTLSGSFRAKRDN
ncbi:MAG: carboxypeptidase-like regulatory domain-containing protein [Crocinitomicaceae bacterium]